MSAHDLRELTRAVALLEQTAPPQVKVFWV